MSAHITPGGLGAIVNAATGILSELDGIRIELVAADPRMAKIKVSFMHGPMPICGYDADLTESDTFEIRGVKIAMGFSAE